MQKPRQSMAKAKSRRKGPPSAASDRPPTNGQPFRVRLLDEAKSQFAKWIVRAVVVVAAAIFTLVIVLSLIIPGAYVDPDGVNWTFGVAEIDKYPVISANAQMPKWFGLRYRNIPSFEWSARNAVNAYLAKHNPTCSIFSISPATADPLVPCEADSSDEAPTCFVEIRGKKLIRSAWWGATAVCK